MPSGRNTSRQILDLGQKNRIDQTRGVTTEPPLIRKITRDSTLQNDQRPASLQASGRTMTLPTLSVSTLQSSNKSSSPISNPQTHQILISSGHVRTDESNDSDKSSICHSPGWDDANIKKRKEYKKEGQDKHRRENEKAGTGPKQKQKPNRLRKPPPTNMRTSKLINHTTSAPTTPTSEAPGAKDKSPDKGRSSINLGFRRFSPWKSVQTTATEKIQQSKNSEGFLGGLKLQQAVGVAVGVTVHENIQNQKTITPKRHTSKFSEEIEASVQDAVMSSSNVQYGGQNSRDAPHNQPTEPTFDQKSFSAKASRPSEVLRSASESESSIPIIDRKTTRERKSEKSNDESLQAAQKAKEASPPTKQDESEVINTSSPMYLRPQMPNKPWKSSAPKSSEGPPLSYREPPELADSEHVRRCSSSYVGSQRKLSMDRSLSGFEDEDRVSSALSDASTERRSRGRSFSFHRSSRASTSRPTTGDSTKSNASKDDNANQPSLVNNNRSAPLTQVTTSFDSKESWGLRRKGSGSSQAPSFKGFRTAARAAFSRHSNSPKSSLDQHESAKFLVSKEGNSRLSNRPSSVNRKPSSNLSNNVEGILGNAIPPVTSQDTRGQDMTTKLGGMGQRTGNSSGSLVQAPVLPKSSNRPKSNSNTATYSSEEHFSTLSQSTAPPANPFPHLVKAGFNDVLDRNTHPFATANICQLRNRNADPVMSGALHDEETANGEPEHGNIMIIPVTNAISSEKTPLPIESSMSAPPRRTPSLSRSASTPELQDLSFLPALKHQPLARPTKGQARYISPTKNSDELLQKSPIAFIQPPRQLPTPPRSEDSSLNSPIGLAGAQYLSHARLALPPTLAPSSRSLPVNSQPLSPSSSSARLPSPSQSSTSISNQENTVAKIFTICCHCRFFHDLPSKVYECMAKQDELVEDKKLGVRGVVSTSVRCSWCGHGMSRTCCEGWMGVVSLKERLH